MLRHEVDVALEWARREGWNPGLHDAEAFHAADPNGFFAAELDGEIVGTISAVAYDDSYGFIGLYIVAPEHRGGPAGVKLLRTAFRYLGNRNAGLDGVLERQEDYAKLGFRFVCSNARYSGILPDSGQGLDTGIVDLGALPFKQIEDYDRRHFPSPRSAFLRSWIQPSGGRGLGIVGNGSLRGCGVIRPCHEGFKIGPLYANTPGDAVKLLSGLGGHAAGATVFLDVPGLNPEGKRLAEQFNMTIVFETARMYLHAKPDVEDECIYGVTTFELG